VQEGQPTVAFASLAAALGADQHKYGAQGISNSESSNTSGRC